MCYKLNNSILFKSKGITHLLISQLILIDHYVEKLLKQNSINFFNESFYD